MAPTITVLGIGVGYMLGSAVFAEIVFARPGIGKLMYDAVILRNYPVTLGRGACRDLDPRGRDNAVGRHQRDHRPALQGVPRVTAVQGAQEAHGLAERLGRRPASGHLRDRWARSAFTVVVLLILSAVFAPLLAPYRSRRHRRAGQAAAALGGPLARHRPARPGRAVARALWRTDRAHRRPGLHRSRPD